MAMTATVIMTSISVKPRDGRFETEVVMARIVDADRDPAVAACRALRSVRLSGQRRAGNDPQVFADQFDARKAQWDSFAQRLQRPERRHLSPLTKQLRRHVDQELVDQAFAHERAVELVASFDMQFVDAAPGEVG